MAAAGTKYPGNNDSGFPSGDPAFRVEALVAVCLQRSVVDGT